MKITGSGIGTRTTRRRGNEKGATVVEFAVIVVLLLLILFAILEFAFIFYQRHFVENAAREGMRVGIRANNYSCFTGCAQDRKRAVEQRVADYLSALYDESDIEVDRVAAEKSLKVSVAVENFFPQLLSGLIPGFANQNTLSYSITGEYEDPDEFDNEE
ncbi:MAG: TadE/TadG family type IV pilus assembly protein [Desulfurivibrionaceae bacterium]|nr:TadE/TadG family type IV pilus assembly protein [Desulfurivibrionaceae bacterium]